MSKKQDRLREIIEKLFQQDPKIKPQAILKSIQEKHTDLLHVTLKEIEPIFSEVYLDFYLNSDQVPPELEGMLLEQKPKSISKSHSTGHIHSKSKIKIFTVICPKCNFSQPYNYRGGKRKHKFCSNPECKKHFDIKANEQTTLNQKIPKNPLLNLNISLGKTDKTILESLLDKDLSKSKNLTKREIAESIKRHFSTISRHVNKLVDMKILEQVPKRVEFDDSIFRYRLNYKFLQTLFPQTIEDKLEDKDKINAISLHHIGAKIPILDKTPITPSYLQNNPDVQSLEIKPMGPKKKPTWYKHLVYINDICFQFNTKCIVVFPKGFGKDHIESIKNLKQKGKQIQTYISNNYPELKPQQVEFFNDDKTEKEGPHFVNERVSINEFEIRQEIWSDNSHPGTVETGNGAMADYIANIGPIVHQLVSDQAALKEEIQNIPTKQDKKLEREILDVKTEIINLRNEFKNFTKEIVSGVKDGLIQAFNTTSKPQTIPRDPPNSYI